MLFRSDMEDATEVLADVFETIIPTAIHDRKALRSSLSEGKSVLEGTDEKAAAEIKNLADDIEKELGYVG